jgi:predicted dehydrogenase
MKKLRVAVVGAGHLGRIHSRLINSLPDAELVGVVDPVTEAREKVAEESRSQPFASLTEVPGLDAAIVATTTEHHHHVGMDLLERGVHLLVEKPLATTLSEANDLVALAKAGNLVLQVGHVERFNPAWQAVESYVRRPRYIEAVRTSGYTFRSIDIGAVLDLMIHDLDLVLAVVRSEVVEVEALGSTIFGPHEDMAHAHLRFANGCIANLNASRTSFQAQRTMQIVSERSYAGLDFGAPSAKVVRPSKAVLRGEIDVRELTSGQREEMRDNLFTDLLPVRDLPIKPSNAILEEQRDFLSCIREGRQPRVTGQQGLRCIALAERILTQIRRSADATRHPAILRSA